MQRSRATAALALVGALPFLILAAWHWRYGPLAQFGDWAQYLLHADALRHGRPYGDIGYIFTSRNPLIGPPVQPPGLPAALVPLLVLTDGARDSALYKVFMILCALAFLRAVASYLTRHGDRPLALASVLVVGLWLEAAFATNVVQPDLACSALIWAVFRLADEPGRWPWKRVAAITLFGLAALSLRLAALPLVPSVALAAAIHRREHGVRSFVPVIVWCLCGAAVVALLPGSIAFARLVPRDPTVLTSAIAKSAATYPFAVLAVFLYPFPWNRVNDAYHLVVAVLCLVGAFIWVPRNRSRLSMLFAACYVAMLLVLPFQDERYLMPIAPFAVFFAGLGAAKAVGWAARLTRHEIADSRALRVSLACVIAIVILALGRAVAGPRPTVMMEEPGVRTLFSRLRAAHDSGTVRAVFTNPRVMTWETGVPAMGFFPATADTTLEEFRARGITHVIVGHLKTESNYAESIRSAVLAHPEAFRRLYSEGVFTVYAFDASRVTRP